MLMQTLTAQLGNLTPTPVEFFINYAFKAMHLTSISSVCIRLLVLFALGPLASPLSCYRTTLNAEITYTLYHF